jgi:hypothetical protein
LAASEQSQKEQMGVVCTPKIDFFISHPFSLSKLRTLRYTHTEVFLLFILVEKDNNKEKQITREKY